MELLWNFNDVQGKLSTAKITYLCKIKICLFVADIEELLGKPVQNELSTETGLDNTLNMLVDLANGKSIL